MELATTTHPSLASGQYQPTVEFAEVRDSYQRNSNWWAIFACFDVPVSDPTPDVIAQMTSLPLNEVCEALEGLCLLGYLRKKGESFEQVEGRDFLHFDYSNVSRAEIIDRHGLVSQQMLNDLASCQRFAFDHRCFAANDAILHELYKDLRAAFDKAFAQAQTCTTGDRIFKMTFTAVDVLSQANGQGKLL